MKSTQSAVLLFCISLLLFPFCAAAGGSKDKKGADTEKTEGSLPGTADNGMVTVTAQVNIYGNDPFIFAGLVTKDGRQYTIHSDKPEWTAAYLSGLSGQVIEWTGKIVPVGPDNPRIYTTLKDGTFILYSFKKKEN